MLEHVTIGAESYFDCQLGCLACIVLHNTETLPALLWNSNPSASLTYSGRSKENGNCFFTRLRHNFDNTRIQKNGCDSICFPFHKCYNAVKKLHTHSLEVPPVRPIANSSNVNMAISSQVPRRTPRRWVIGRNRLG